MDNAQISLPKCPECDTALEISKEALVGQIVECPSCGTESEILTLNPFSLAPLEEEK